MERYMQNGRLAQQLQFIIEIDKLKQILRQSRLSDNSRRENSAEHSWHIALMAFTLAEHAGEPLNLLQAMKMLLLHDIVEIDAGDTYSYDVEANLDKAERETLAAERLFGLLPADQAAEFRLLWEEFEQQETPESRFANAMDRLHPLLLNYQNRSDTWRRHGIKRSQVEVRMQPVSTGAPACWSHVQQIIEELVGEGYLLE
jgi:putative hydrolases of HD superfamily